MTTPKPEHREAARRIARDLLTEFYSHPDTATSFESQCERLGDMIAARESTPSPAVGDAERDRMWCAALLREDSRVVQRVTEAFNAIRDAAPAAPSPADVAMRVSDAAIAEAKADVSPEAGKQCVIGGVPIIITRSEFIANLCDDLRDTRQALAAATMRLDKIAEREAVCCPEDVGFDEHIKALRVQLTLCEESNRERREIQVAAEQRAMAAEVGGLEYAECLSSVLAWVQTFQINRPPPSMPSEWVAVMHKARKAAVAARTGGAGGDEVGSGT